jgi:integrase
MRKAPTLGAVAGEWLGTRGKSASKGHRRAAEQSLEALGSLGKLPLDRITTPIVQSWQAAYLQGHSAASANLVLRYLKLWMRWAMGQKLIREMPYSVRPEKQQERPRPVVEDVDGFLARVDAGARNPQVPAAVRFAMMLGLRESEVLQARWEWLKDGSYTVAGRTKSRKVRTVPVPEPLRVALVLMLAAQQHGPAQAPRLGLMFPGRDGRPHRQGWLRQALQRGGVGGLGMHRLRATFATLHLRKGTPLKEVQEMMGHGDARTTLLYQEGSQDEKRKSQDALWA